MEENIINTTENLEEIQTQEEKKTEEVAIIEYKEIDEPCVALTIIGENKLSVTASLVKRGFKFSLKTFFSTLLLTIAKMFI